MSIYLISFFKLLCLFVFSNTKINNLRTSGKQIITSKVLTIPCHWRIGRIRPSKIKIEFTVTHRGISFNSTSNNTPSSPLYCVGIKIKAAPEEKSKE